MSFWDTTNAAKPTGVKDPDAVLDYPIDYSTWLTDISDTYASHVVLVDGVTLDSSSHSAGKITPILSGGVAGTTASFTVRITTTGGRIDDRTFYLKIKNR